MNIKKIKKHLAKIKKLKAENFKVVFENEGNVTISLPEINIKNYARKGQKLLEFSSRPNKEALLRKVVYELFEQGYLDKSKSIIDIGCWLADNSLVWASLIEDDSVVHAVDPSADNILFGKELAERNNINNINWVEAVCSDEAGIPLNFKGSIDHASFKEAEELVNNNLFSTTLDNIVMNSPYKEISLIHVDVEGFEEKVLRGAESIIDTYKPVILFEQHISEENVGKIVSYLEEKGYQVFMINEVLPGCHLDCRNFIAFNSSIPLPELPKLEHCYGRKENIWYASMGEALIPVK